MLDDFLDCLRIQIKGLLETENCAESIKIGFPVLNRRPGYHPANIRIKLHGTKEDGSLHVPEMMSLVGDDPVPLDAPEHAIAALPLRRDHTISGDYDRSSLQLVHGDGFDLFAVVDKGIMTHELADNITPLTHKCWW